MFGPHVRGWNVDGGAAVAISGVNLFAFDYTEWGVRVGVGDTEEGGSEEILAAQGPGPDYTAKFKVFSYDGTATTMVDVFTSFSGEGITHGAKVSAGVFAEEVPE
jgi:hypothetical protein